MSRAAAKPATMRPVNCNSSPKNMRRRAADSEIPDRRLALLFACAHPAIEVSARAPLMLQVVLGLDAKTIAAAFLTSPSAMSKRLVRAKDKIRQAGIPFRIPERDELPARLDTVLESIYATFAEGWSDPAGTDAVRRDLTEESLFLARLVVELLPNEPEALGLLALMLHTEARRRARRNQAGDYVPLAEQDPGAWDSKLIDEAEALLRRASTLGTPRPLSAGSGVAVGARCSLAYRQANWQEVVQLYDALSGADRIAGGRRQSRASVGRAARRHCRFGSPASGNRR